MSNKKISVIIPVYNVEAYLEACLDSVIGQTYKNIEIIAINDGSTDRSQDILESYNKKYSNIIIINQENQGQSIARNMGIEKAKGDYIYFLDSDDYLKAETFQYLIGVFEENEVDLISFSAEVFLDKIKLQVNKDRYKLHSYFEQNQIYLKNEFLTIATRKFTPSPVLYIMKRSLIQDNNIRFKPGVIHEDELFTTEIFLNTNKMLYIAKSFYKRRYREGSTMTLHDKQHKKNSFLSKCEILTELQRLLDEYTDLIEVSFLKARIRNIIKSLSIGYPGLTYGYKINKIRDIQVPFISVRYHYHLLRQKIGKMIKKV